MSYLGEPSRHFCQHFMRRTTQQTFAAINLASKQKTIKLSFLSSQLRKQFKLLTVHYALRCCLQSDKLVNCHVWKFYKDLFLNFRVIWSVNQIVLFNGFLSDFVEEISPSDFFQGYFQSRWIVALGLFTSPLSRLGQYSHYSPRFQIIFVNYFPKKVTRGIFLYLLPQSKARGGEGPESLSTDPPLFRRHKKQQRILIFPWDRRDITCLTVNGRHLDFQMYRGGGRRGLYRQLLG